MVRRARAPSQRAGLTALQGPQHLEEEMNDLVEMVLLMLAGMGVLSGLATLLFSAAGSSLSDPSGGFRVAPWV